MKADSAEIPEFSDAEAIAKLFLAVAFVDQTQGRCM
jgi:hypothetical protein